MQQHGFKDDGHNALTVGHPNWSKEMVATVDFKCKDQI